MPTLYTDLRGRNISTNQFSVTEYYKPSDPSAGQSSLPGDAGPHCCARPMHTCCQKSAGKCGLGPGQQEELVQCHLAHMPEMSFSGHGEVSATSGDVRMTSL